MKAQGLVGTFLLLCSLHYVSCETTNPAKKYTINLDEDAYVRWSQVAIDHAPALAKLASEIGQLVPEAVIKIVSALTIDVADILPYPYGVELAGLAKTANVSEKLLLLANMVYELTAYNRSGDTGPKACTSIVAELPNGTIVHARNFDYGLSSALRDLVIQVDFLENGKVSYTGTTFAGLVGLPSAQKPHAFTISINERNSGSFWENAFQALIDGTHGIAHLVVRDTVANPTFDFKMAAQSIASTPLITTVYVIMGGLQNEGVVITHGRPQAINEWWLGSNNSWFLVETNYDHWKAPPADDDRRDVAIKGMVDVGKTQVSMSQILNVLSIPPVLNPGTIFTNTMSASMPEQYESWVRVPN